jgi:DNA-binding Lrp family transcriptional regulator
MNIQKTKEQPSYYAVLTADVRYSKVLKPNEKLLFAEITALTNMNGQCFATNKYFAELYDVSVETVSRWVSNLEKLGFIKRTIKYKEGSKQIDKRFISLATPIDEKVNTPLDNKVKTPIDEKVKGNSTSINSLSLIGDFYPDEVSLNVVRNTYGDVSLHILKIAIEEFKDAALNRAKPFKNVQSGFRTYVRQGWLLSFTNKQTHAQMRGQVIQAQNKPNLDKLALQRSMKKLERANG